MYIVIIQSPVYAYEVKVNSVNSIRHIHLIFTLHIMTVSGMENTFFKYFNSLQNLLFISTGPAWFDRFGYLEPNYQMVFPSEKVVEDFMYSVHDLKNWQSETKSYVLNNNRKEKMKSPSEIVFMECDRFVVNKNATVDVIVSQSIFSLFSVLCMT